MGLEFSPVPRGKPATWDDLELQIKDIREHSITSVSKTAGRVKKNIQRLTADDPRNLDRITRAETLLKTRYKQGEEEEEARSSSAIYIALPAYDGVSDS